MILHAKTVVYVGNRVDVNVWLDIKELNAKWRDEEKNERENYKQIYKQSSITTRRKQLLCTTKKQTYYRFVCFFSCIRHDLSITYYVKYIFGGIIPQRLFNSNSPYSTVHSWVSDTFGLRKNCH